MAKQLVMPWAKENKVVPGAGFREVLKSLSLNTLIILRKRMVLQGEGKVAISCVDAEIETRTV